MQGKKKPRWSLDYPTPNSFSYSFLIESEHDESNLNSDRFFLILVNYEFISF